MKAAGREPEHHGWSFGKDDLLPFSERYMGYSYFYILTLRTDLCRRRGSGGACLQCAASREP